MHLPCGIKELVNVRDSTDVPPPTEPSGEDIPTYLDSNGCVAVSTTCVAPANTSLATFTKAVQKCNASKAASLDFVQLIWALLSDGLVFRKLPNLLSLSGAGIITAASLGSMLWTFQHPSQAMAGEQGAAAACPQQYKRQYYLMGARSAPKAGGGGKHRTGRGLLASSSETEAVSLLKGEAGGSHLCWPQGSEEPASDSGAGNGGGGQKGWLGGVSGNTDEHVAKLAVAGSYLTDSSKSWQLGTELETVLAAEAAAATAGGSCCEGAGGRVGGGACSDSGACLELQAVGFGPAAMRTSTEKEQALVAAGK